MAAIIAPADALLSGGRGRTRSKSKVRTGFRVSRLTQTVILILVGLFFLIPIASTMRYALEGGGVSWGFYDFDLVFHDGSLVGPLMTSLEIAAGAVVLTILLVLPTSIWVNLRVPHLRTLMDSIALLPLVVPVVVLVLGIYGVFGNFPNFFIGTPVILCLEYVVLALPYSYRAIDTGVQSMDIHTLVDAGRSLGSSWLRLFAHVLLPGLRSALLSAAFLTVSFVLGEFALANLMSFSTFSTQLYQIGTEQAGEAIALSVISLLLVWGVLAVIAVAGGGRRRRNVDLAEEE